MTSAIIVASGSSQRMGFDKLTALLRGKPVLQRTIEAFLAAESISSIIVVCPKDRWDKLRDLHRNLTITRIDGGEQRQDSVEQGLKAVRAGTCFVAVHDGARPLVSANDIDRCVAAAKAHGAASLARRVTETMKRSDTDDFSSAAVSRDQLWCMETPQAFDIDLLNQAYQHVTAQGLNVTDEVSALQAIGQKVKFIESHHPNLKITTPADLAIADAMLKIED